MIHAEKALDIKEDYIAPSVEIALLECKDLVLASGEAIDPYSDYSVQKIDW